MFSKTFSTKKSQGARGGRGGKGGKTGKREHFRSAADYQMQWNNQFDGHIFIFLVSLAPSGYLGARAVKSKKILPHQPAS